MEKDQDKVIKIIPIFIQTGWDYTDWSATAGPYNSSG